MTIVVGLVAMLVLRQVIRSGEFVAAPVPEGDDADLTRLPSYYDGTFAYLRSVGLPVLE